MVAFESKRKSGPDLNVGQLFCTHTREFWELMTEKGRVHTGADGVDVASASLDDGTQYEVSFGSSGVCTIKVKPPGQGQAQTIEIEEISGLRPGNKQLSADHVSLLWRVSRSLTPEVGPWGMRLDKLDGE